MHLAHGTMHTRAVSAPPESVRHASKSLNAKLLDRQHSAPLAIFDDSLDNRVSRTPNHSQPMYQKPQFSQITVMIAAFFWAILFGACIWQGLHFHKAVTCATILPACTILWNFVPIPIDYTAMGVLSIFTLTGTLKFDQAFIFASSSNFWVVWSGMIVGAAITETGLMEWITRAVGAGEKFMWHVVRVILCGVFSALLIPSAVVRVCVMVPAVVRLAKEGGGADRYSSLQVECLLVTAVCAALFPGVGVLTAALPNLVVADVYGHITGGALMWSSWFVKMFAIWSGVGSLVVFAVVRLVYTQAFRNDLASATQDPERNDPERNSADSQDASCDLEKVPEQQKLVIYLLCACALWSTDKLTGIDRGSVAILLVFMICMPRYGVLPLQNMQSASSFRVLLFFVAMVSMSEAMEHSGLVSDLAHTNLLHALDGKSVVLQYWVIIMVVFAVTLFSESAIASVLTSTLFIQIVSEPDYNAELKAEYISYAIGMGAGLAVAPYQFAPMLVGQKLWEDSGLSVDGWRLCSVLTLISVVNLAVLAPITIVLFFK